MELFKGAIYLLDGRLKIHSQGQDFEPLGNAVATRQWLQDTFAAANDPAASVDADAAVETPTETKTAA